MKRAFVVLLLMGLVGLGALVAYRIKQGQKAEPAPVDKAAEAVLIHVAKAELRNVDEKVTFTGSVLPRNEVDVFTKLPGRIETLSVKVGDKVHTGQLLAEVEHKELGWQAKSAAAALGAATAALKASQANYDGVKLDFERTKALFDGGSAPMAQLDGARIRLRAAEAQIGQAQAGVTQAEAARGLADQQLSNSRIEAPISGVITRKSVNLGVNAGSQTAAFTIQDVATLRLESSVQASVFAQLQHGMSADITVDAFPGETFHGEVDVLSPTLDPQTRRAAIEIAIDNTKGRLLPHMFAHADVTVGHLKDVLTVPKDSVLEAAGGSVVFRVKGSAVEVVRPKFGPEDGDYVVVEQGLLRGDELARGGLGNLSDGAAVRVSVAMTQKD